MQHERKFFYFCGDEQFQPEKLVEHAILAENSGFDGILISEHFNPWVADVGTAGFAFAILGAIAVSTRELQLMTGVVTPLFRYHPAIIAQASATIDRLSGGRFALGVGTGELLNEAPLGYKFPSYKKRAARMREALNIMNKLLKGEKVTYNGDYYHMNNCKLYSPPVIPTPVYLAAAGPKSARIAGELADGLIVSVKNPKDSLDNIIIPARNEADRRMRPLKLLTTKWTIFAKSDQEAWQAIRPWRGLRAPHGSTISNPEDLQHEADSLLQKEILNKYTIISSVDDFVDVYKPLMTELNADIIVFQSVSIDQAKLIRKIGEKGLPILRKV